MAQPHTSRCVVWTAVLSHTIHIQFEVIHFPCLCIWGKSCSLTQRRSSALSKRISHWAHPRQKKGHCTVPQGSANGGSPRSFGEVQPAIQGTALRGKSREQGSVKNGKRMRIHIHMCLFLHEESTRRVKSYWKIGGVWQGTGLSRPGIQPVEDAYALPIPPRLLRVASGQPQEFRPKSFSV